MIGKVILTDSKYITPSLVSKLSQSRKRSKITNDPSLNIADVTSKLGDFGAGTKCCDGKNCNLSCDESIMIAVKLKSNCLSVVKT